MLSIDTPEIHYPGNQKPSKQDQNLAQLVKWFKEDIAPIHKGLAEYLLPKLETGQAGTLHLIQGEAAYKYFTDLTKDKLTLSNGRKRSVFVRTSNQPFDQYGRLLAYMAPNYNKTELSKLTLRKRATFNLLMVETGWAAPFPIYPSLPSYNDLVLLNEVGKEAYDLKKGIWSDPLTLTGYEFRMCVKLFDITKKIAAGESLSLSEKESWISRYCMDMTTQEIFFPQDYYRVEPYNRIFIWPQDVSEAVAKLNLTPAEVFV